MQGLLADRNLEGHCARLEKVVLPRLGLLGIVAELHLMFATFSDLHLPDELEDRILWNYCQEHGWVLFTDNRNKDGPNSLEATLAESWQSGNLPVLTLSNKKTFEYSDEYQDRVGKDIAELLFGLYDGEFRDLRRIFVPTG